jgi:hypothetical protein
MVIVVMGFFPMVNLLFRMVCASRAASWYSVTLLLSTIGAVSAPVVLKLKLKHARSAAFRVHRKENAADGK